ncbi:MAG: PHP domain-containing protein [Bryobacteraceae bacterium]|nr:PHP domain-containing protein [Bryobacteraceae bacterium]
MIDLHSHTTESDGTFTPQGLIDAGVAAGLEALAITDHDTFSGYELAREYASSLGLPLIRGIELSTKVDFSDRRTVHLLGYFLHGEPSAEFVTWLQRMQDSRRDRNSRLATRLQSMGVNITLNDVDAIGRNMAGRPHFARLMVNRGYVSNYREAFDRYLDESAPGYVDREEPLLADAIERLRRAGGMSSLAHPVRLNFTSHEAEEQLVSKLADQGLDAIEVWHSDHTAVDSARYLNLAAKYGLRMTGGSDFHGDNKPNVRLGVGPGTLNVPLSALNALRS